MANINLFLMVVVVVLGIGSAVPVSNCVTEGVPMVIQHGYYASPMGNGGAMATFAAAGHMDPAFTNGRGCPACLEYADQKPNDAPIHFVPNEDDSLPSPTNADPIDFHIPQETQPEPSLEPAPTATSGKVGPPKRRRTQKTNDDSDDDVRSGVGPYNVFFPMVFGGEGGYGSLEGRKGSNGRPGGSSGPTAIANSFSTGRSGVATSHATAYGAGHKGEN